MASHLDWIFLLCDDCGETNDQCHDCHVKDRLVDEMRRYLYRNVACEYRKVLSDFHKMPDIPGWL